MPSILPACPNAAQDARQIARMSRVDGCPDCVTNLEPPYRVEQVARGFIAYYGCEACGFFWNTGWSDA